MDTERQSKEDVAIASDGAAAEAGSEAAAPIIPIDQPPQLKLNIVDFLLMLPEQCFVDQAETVAYRDLLRKDKFLEKLTYYLN